MTSTEFNIGLVGSKNSSRVLKPPGGGHSNIFGAPDQQAPAARPKYDQQNSTNLNFCMNTTDPNVKVEQQKQQQPTEAPQQQQQQQNGNAAAASNGGPDASRSSSADSIGAGSQKPDAAKQNRVPPGGFSSGLW